MTTLGKALVAVIAILIIGWFAFTMQGTSTAPPGGPTIVKIGVIAPLSGDAAAYGQETQKILNHRLKEINAEESPVKFELVYEDGKCSGSDAVSAFQKLTDVDGVKIMLAGGCSSETLGIAPLTKDGKALAVSFLSSNPTIEGASRYVMTFSYTDQVIGETLADVMSSSTKVAIISEQNDYNIGIKTVWEKKIAEYPNVKVVANELFPKGASDFRNLLLKIRKTNPDAILLNPNVGVTAESLLKQLAEIKDWKGYTIYSQIAYLADNTRTSVGGFANGMVIVDAPNLTDPAFLAYKAEIEKEEGAIPTLGNYYTAAAIDDLTIVTSLIREIGNDQTAVRDALSTRTFTGYLGSIAFNGHSFKQGSKGGIYHVEDGKAVFQQ